jgi:hypothetical protein
LTLEVRVMELANTLGGQPFVMLRFHWCIQACLSRCELGYLFSFKLVGPKLAQALGCDDSNRHVLPELIVVVIRGCINKQTSV